MSETKPFNAAEYLAYSASQKNNIVDVVLPSGFTIQYRKPSKAELLFQTGTLPQSAIANALKGWKQTIETGEVDEQTSEDQKLVEAKAVALRNAMLERSYFPKLVLGDAQKDNEFSVKFLSDDDLDYLVQWNLAGGDESILLSMFPSRRKPSLASSSRGKK